MGELSDKTDLMALRTARRIEAMTSKLAEQSAQQSAQTARTLQQVTIQEPRAAINPDDHAGCGQGGRPRGGRQ